MDIKNNLMGMSVGQLQKLHTESYDNKVKQNVIQQFINYKINVNKQQIKQKKERKKSITDKKKQDHIIDDIVDDLIDDVMSHHSHNNEQPADDDEFELARKDMIKRKSTSRLACDIDVKNMQKHITKKEFDPPYDQ